MSTRSPVSAGSTLKLAPSLVWTTKPLLTPAQIAAGPVSATVRPLAFLTIEEVLRAARLSQRRLLPLYFACRLGHGDRRILNGLVHLVLRRGWLHLGLRDHPRGGHRLCRNHRLFSGPRFLLGGFADDGD